MKDQASLIDQDPILPERIEHRCQQLFEGGRLEQVYNFLDYWFRTPSGHIRARAYLDAMTTVVVHGPFATADGAVAAKAPIDPKVLAYLRRRFATVRLAR